MGVESLKKNTHHLHGMYDRNIVNMVAQPTGCALLKDPQPYRVLHNTIAQDRRSGTLGGPQALWNSS